MMTPTDRLIKRRARVGLVLLVGLALGSCTDCHERFAFTDGAHVMSAYYSCLIVRQVDMPVITHARQNHLFRERQRITPDMSCEALRAILLEVPDTEL